MFYANEAIIHRTFSKEPKNTDFIIMVAIHHIIQQYRIIVLIGVIVAIFLYAYYINQPMQQLPSQRMSSLVDVYSMPVVGITNDIDNNNNIGLSSSDLLTKQQGQSSGSDNSRLQQQLISGNFFL